MLRFIFRQFQLSGRYYAPLPKLNHRQRSALRRRLESVGFRTSNGDPMKASKSGARLIVDRHGLCSSNEDMSDVIAPVLPEILGYRRQKVSFKTLRESYLRSENHGEASVIRFLPRLESGSLWEELRSWGDCALTPDEWAVYSAILAACPSLTPLVTDFSTPGSIIRRIGRRQYYDSGLAPDEAANTLRRMDWGGQRNTYLPANQLPSSVRPYPQRRNYAASSTTWGIGASSL